GLAIGKPDRSRKCVVRMNLDRQRLGCEEKFEQQRRLWHGGAFSETLREVWTFKPQFPDRAVACRGAAPRAQIGAAPGLRLGSCNGMFDRQDVVLICGAADRTAGLLLFG